MKKLLSVLLAVLLIAGMLSGTVSAADAKQAWVRLPGVDSKGARVSLMLTVNEGAPATYYVTNDAGLATATGASADNYNIKLEYPTGGAFTITLKNAYLADNQWNCISIGRVGYSGSKDITGFPAIIYTEADSTLLAKTKDPEATICGYVAIGCANQDTVTITGPGKLTATAESNNTITGPGGGKAGSELIIKDANLKVHSIMPAGWGVRGAIWNKNGPITIENSTLDLYATAGPCLWNCASVAERVGDKYDITIKNSEIKCVADVYSTENATIGSRGTITVDTSKIEIISTGAAAKKGVKCFLPKPVLVGVNAIAGNTAEKVEAYNEKKNSTYFYFKCAPGLELPTEPTEPQPTTPVDPKPTTPTEPKPTTPGATTPTTPDATTPTTPDATTPTTPDATTPTTPGATTPNATNPTGGNNATKPTTGNNNTTGTTPTTGDADKTDADKADDKGTPVILWIVIGVVVAGGIAAAVIFVLKKKKAADAK